MRTRNIFIPAILALFILTWIVVDPDSSVLSGLPMGGQIILVLSMVALSLVGVLVMHVARKSIHDYKSADIDVLGKKAMSTPEGAGLHSVAMAVNNLAIAIIVTGIMVAMLV